MADDVLSSVNTEIKSLAMTAAVFSKAEERISIYDWLEQSYVLVLGSSNDLSVSLKRFNAFFFRRVASLIKAQSDSTTRRTWIFLDEAKETGKLDGLAELLSFGRSKGCCTVLGVQDYTAFKAVHGDFADSMLGLCGNRAFFRSNDFQTAKWMSENFGKHETIDIERAWNASINRSVSLTETESLAQSQSKTTSTGDSLTETEGESKQRSETDGHATGTSSSVSSGPGGSTSTRGGSSTTSSSTSDSIGRSSSSAYSRSGSRADTEGTTETEGRSRNSTSGSSEGVSASERLREKEIVPPLIFLELSLPNIDDGLPGYYQSRLGNWKQLLPGRIVEQLVPVPDPSVPGWVKTPHDHQTLEDWSPLERESLGLPSFPTELTADDLLREDR